MTDQPTGFAEGGYDPAEDTPTATGRAGGLVAKAMFHSPAGGHSDLARSEAVDLAIVGIAALNADPDLLVDLAIEAGGLEQVGWLDTWGRKHLLDMAKSPEGHACDEASPHLESVYRRTPTEANDA